MAGAESKARGRARWHTAAFFILSGLISATWSSRIPDVQQRMHLNDAAWGRVLFLLPAGLMLGLFVASWLTTRFGVWKMMLAGCILGSLLLFGLGSAASVPQLSAALFLMGFVRTIFNISINTSSLEVQKLYERPVLSTFHGLWSLACFGAAGIGTAMIVWEVAPARHFAGVALLCSAIGLTFHHRNRGKKHLAPEKRPFFVRPNRYLLLLGLMAFCAMICESAMFDWSVNYFEKVVRAGKGSVTAGYTAFIIAMALGRLSGDRVIAVLGITRLLMFNGLLIALGFALAVFFPYLLPATLGFLLVGLGDSIVIPQVYALSARTDAMPPSYALASIGLIGSTGFLTGPILIGTLSEALGMQWALLTVGCFGLCIAGLTRMVEGYLKPNE